MSCSIEVRLKPRAKNDRIALSNEGFLDVAVTSPPVEGKANAHLLMLLAKTLRLPRSSLSFLKGEHSRRKVVKIDGLTKDEIQSLIRGDV